MSIPVKQNSANANYNFRLLTEYMGQPIDKKRPIFLKGLFYQIISQSSLLIDCGAEQSKWQYYSSC